MNRDPHDTHQGSGKDGRSPQSEAEPSGPVSPPAPTGDRDGDETGGYEKRPQGPSTDNAKGGYGAG